MIKLSFKKEKEGFTLIETMVAVIILTLAITGPMTIAQTGLSASRYARDSLTASLLATEAIEVIRNKRDSNYVGNNGDWLGELNGKLNEIFDIDIVDDGSFVNCTTTCPPLNYDKTRKLYTHLNGANYEVSKFTRTIDLERIRQREISIKVIVNWKSGVIAKQYVVVEHIYDWYDNNN